MAPAFDPLRRDPDRRLLLGQPVGAGRWRHYFPARRIHPDRPVDPDDRDRTHRYPPPRPLVDVPVVDRRRRHLDQRRDLRRLAAAGNVRSHCDDRPHVDAGAASLRCLQDRDRDDSCRPGDARCPLWVPVEEECKPPRGVADHEAGVRWRGQRGTTVRSAQRRSARVVGSDPCRRDDTPDRSRSGSSVRRKPILSERDLLLDRHQWRDHDARTPSGSPRDRPLPRHHRHPVARVNALFSWCRSPVSGSASMGAG